MDGCRMSTRALLPAVPSRNSFELAYNRRITFGASVSTSAQSAQRTLRVDSAYKRCRELGMRLSKQRRMVLDLLWQERSHLSARDIFEKLNNQGRNIGHTSIYQNLEALQSAGVIECLDRAGGRLYGYRSDPHSHLICSQSGQIQDLDLQLPQELLVQIEESTGFRVESYSVQLTGRPR